jgi:hypothetical protein
MEAMPGSNSSNSRQSLQLFAVIFSPNTQEIFGKKGKADYKYVAGNPGGELLPKSSTVFRNMV